MATVRRVGDKQIVGIMYKVPPLSHPDNAAVQVLSALLSQSPGGRLYKALVDTKLAAGIVGLTFDLREPGALIAWADVRKEQSLDSARTACCARWTTCGPRRSPSRKWNGRGMKW